MKLRLAQNREIKIDHLFGALKTKRTLLKKAAVVYGLSEAL